MSNTLITFHPKQSSCHRGRRVHGQNNVYPLDTGFLWSSPCVSFCFLFAVWWDSNSNWMILLFLAADLNLCRCARVAFGKKNAHMKGMLASDTRQTTSFALLNFQVQYIMDLRWFLQLSVNWPPTHSLTTNSSSLQFVLSLLLRVSKLTAVTAIEA